LCGWETRERHHKTRAREFSEVPLTLCRSLPPPPPPFSSTDDLSTSFPTFGPTHSALNRSDLGFLAWSDCMCPGHVGPWTAAGVSPNNFGSTGGVVALFNRTLGTLVLSALDNYMTAGLTWSASLNNVFGAGFNGNLDGIPAGWKHQTVLVAGVGVNDTMNAWGDILLAAGGKTRTPIDGDFQTSYLSYWTDNGAYVSARQESGGRAWWESSSSLSSPAHPPTHAHPSPSPHSPHHRSTTTTPSLARTTSRLC
jgi:hypothetical protein